MCWYRGEGENLQSLIFGVYCKNNDKLMFHLQAQARLEKVAAVKCGSELLNQ